MAIDVSFRDGYSTSAQDLSRFNKNFLINEGVANDGLKVSQSAVPAMSVQVSIGNAYFYGTGTTADTMFEFYSDSTETVTIPTASAQARIDIVCCKVDVSTGVASLVVVSGTPSGSPAVPATPASHYKLANVAVGAGVTTITNANITDTRRTMFMVPTGARNQGLINGYIIPSVSSNNLTVAISTSPTSVVAPTATNPVFVWIGGVLRPITSALSFTRNAGTNSLNMGSSELATRAIDLFAYCQWNTTTNSVNLLASRIDNARRMSDFVNSATDSKGVLGIVNYNSTDDVVNIGRFEATLSASASFNWSVPTYTSINLIQEPTRGTRWLTYTPTVSGSGSMTLSAGTIILARYKIENGICFIQIQGDNYTTGGTASNFIRASLPISQNSAMLGNFRYGSTYFVNNGANTVGQYGFGTTGVVEFGKQDVSNLALGTGYYFGVISQYEI